MPARRFSAGLLLALFFNPNGGPATLRHVDPATMAPTGAALRLATFNELQVDGGRTVVWTRRAVRVVDTGALRVIGSYPLARRDVCTVGLDGGAAVALVGCSSATSRRYALIRFGALGRTTVRLRLPLAPLAYPVSFAFGDGTLFAARGSGEVDAIGLRTGRVTIHRPPQRTLAKGGPWVQASWLGEHQLGLNGRVVDVRTWHRRTIASHARRIQGDGPWLTTYGPAGVTVWTRDLHLFRRFLRGQYVDQARVADGALYARIALVWHRFDVRTGRSLGQVVPDGSWQMTLL